MGRKPPPPLEALLSGVPADECSRSQGVSRAQSIDQRDVAGILSWLKRARQIDRNYAPIEKDGRALSERRQRFRRGPTAFSSRPSTCIEARARFSAARPGVLDETSPATGRPARY